MRKKAAPTEFFPVIMKDKNFEKELRQINKYLQIFVEEHNKVIEELKVTKKILLESEQKFKSLFDNVSDCIFIANPRTKKLITGNKAASLMFGYSPEELNGLNIDNFHPEKNIPYVMGQFEKQARGEINLVLDIPCIRKDGSVFYADINSFDITIDGIKYLAGIFRDITGRKKTEEILLSYQNKLEEMLKKKTLELVKAQKDIQDATRLSDIGTLAATIAHELRNPLGVIKVAVYNIKRKTPGDMIDDHIDNINKKIGECDRIIKNLLSYSHIKISNYENIRIMDVLKMCMDNLKTIYQKWDVEIKVKSNCRTTNTIEADSTQINEIFSNILENAYQSFPGKKGTIEIDMDCNSQENKIIIIFRDNGIGIDEKDLPKITDPFFTTKARGIGLGLTVCKQIVSLHKGELEFQSVKGKGTTVVISLPIRRKL